MALITTNQQNQLKKRQITEFDLTNFIVESCSADKIDTIIENLCDQTFQSALIGNFPSLISYCRISGRGQRFCHLITEQTSKIDIENSKDLSSIPQHRKLQKQIQKKNLIKKNDRDLETEMIFEICLNNDETISIEITHLCNETLLLIRQGNYSSMRNLCKNHDESSFCHSINSMKFNDENQRRKRRRREI